MSHITEDISTGIAAIKPITTGTQSNQMLSLFNVLAILFASVARAGYDKQVRRILTFKVCSGGKNDSMAEIFLHNKPIKSVFHLLGEHENDITYSVAWALAQSPSFLNRFIELATGKSIDTPNVVIRLQQHEQQGGITDIEIESPGRLHLIIEAKRGWNLPGLEQLKTYVGRYSFVSSAAVMKRILPLSECSRQYALHRLGCSEISGIDIQPISWKEMATLAEEASYASSYSEKRVLRELLTYLRDLMRMQNIDSNWVYVVSLGPGVPEGWLISWIDIVRMKSAYFHPVGGSWPKEPPNYIAFRYGGRLQSMHHIEGWQVFEDPHEAFPEIPSVRWDTHFLYRLGRAFSPAHEVRTGNIYPNGRVWCMLDTLFTAGTIAEARDISRKRGEGESH